MLIAESDREVNLTSELRSILASTGQDRPGSFLFGQFLAYLLFWYPFLAFSKLLHFSCLAGSEQRSPKLVNDNSLVDGLICQYFFGRRSGLVACFFSSASEGIEFDSVWDDLLLKLLRPSSQSENFWALVSFSVDLCLAINDPTARSLNLLRLHHFRLSYFRSG